MRCTNRWSTASRKARRGGTTSSALRSASPSPLRFRRRHARAAGQSLCHTLAEALEQVTILTDCRPRLAVVYRGYRGHGVAETGVLIGGARRGVTLALAKALRRRSSVEPEIGHVKTDGRLSRCFLKGTLGDAIFAVLCGCGHNIRKILAHLRALLATIISVVLAIIRQNWIGNSAARRPPPAGWNDCDVGDGRDGIVEPGSASRQVNQDTVRPIYRCPKAIRRQIASSVWLHLPDPYAVAVPALDRHLFSAMPGGGERTNSHVSVHNPDTTARDTGQDPVGSAVVLPARPSGG